MFIDTHAHLFYQNFEDDLPSVIREAGADYVDKIIVPATDIKTSESVAGLCSQFPGLYGTVGVHPHDTKDWDPAWIGRLRELASHPKIVGIGEIGLDYFYDFSPKEKQMEAFRAQLNLAIELDLPVVIHTRDSDDDILAVIREYAGSGLRAQFHCFGGSIAFAREVIAMHHYISFTGNITFKKADAIRETVKNIPLEHIMLETDSPFMTPVPYRGKRNEPKYVKLVAQTLADIHNVTLQEIAGITSYNALRFFGIGQTDGLTLVYQLGDSLYINITNRCNADCVFCARKNDPVLGGYNLKMTKNEEPDAAEYIKRIGNPSLYKEIVFCGYGEPTIRWDVVKEIAGFVKTNGGSTRLNTNGHGNLINKRDITPEFRNLIDVVSVSLNSHDRKQYSDIMRLPEKYFDEMLAFSTAGKDYSSVILSVVDYPEIDKTASGKLAESIGVGFRIRPYF